jgi:hypothetical protein
LAESYRLLAFSADHSGHFAQAEMLYQVALRYTQERERERERGEKKDQPHLIFLFWSTGKRQRRLGFFIPRLLRSTPIWLGSQDRVRGRRGREKLKEREDKR